MNKLDQIKHNLNNGLPIDSEETLSAIMELEAKLIICNDMARSHKEFFAKEGYLHEALQIQEFIDSEPKQSLQKIQSTYLHTAINRNPPVCREQEDYIDELWLFDAEQAKEQK